MSFRRCSLFARGRGPAIAAIVVASGGTQPLVAGESPSVVASSWISPLNGDWFDPSNWSSGVVPNNSVGVVHDALLGTLGAPYTARLNADAAVRSLLLEGPDATLLHTAGTLRTSNASIAGSFVLNGGSIEGGAWDVAPGGGLRVRGSLGSQIVGADIRGAIGVEGGATLTLSDTSFESLRLLDGLSVVTLADDLTTRGTLSFEGSSASVRIVRSEREDALIHLEKGALVRVDTGPLGRGVLGDLTGYKKQRIVNDGRIEILSGSLAIGAGEIENRGEIDLVAGSLIAAGRSILHSGSISANGATVQLLAESMRNEGSIVVTDGALSFGQDLLNLGTIDALRSTVTVNAASLASGTMTLRDSSLRVLGVFGYDDLASIGRVNSQLINAGVLNNSGRVFDLEAIPEPFVMERGTIRGGVVESYGSNRIRFAEGTTNVLDGVEHRGTLGVTHQNTVLRLLGDAALRGAVELEGFRAEIRSEGSLLLEGVDVRTIGSGPVFFSTESPGATLRIGADASISGRNTVFQPFHGGSLAQAFATIENLGTIHAAQGSSWDLHAQTVTNAGSITLDEQARVRVNGGFDNTNGSTRIAQGASLVLRQRSGAGALAGEYANDGLIVLSGELALDGATAQLKREHGAVTLGDATSGGAPGTISGGTLIIDPDASLTVRRQGNRFDSVIAHGSITLANNGSLLANGSVFDSVVVNSGGFFSLAGSSVRKTTTLRGGRAIAEDLRDLGSIIVEGAPLSRFEFADATGGVVGADLAVQIAQGASLRIDGVGQDSTLRNEFRWDQSGAGQVILAGGTVENRAEFSLGSNLTLEARNAVVNLADIRVRSGVLRLDGGAGQVFNFGAIVLSPGATLQLAGAGEFQNSGLVVANGGRVVYSSPAQIGDYMSSRLDLTGSELFLSRSLDLEGATLAIDPSRGRWIVSGPHAVRNGVFDNAGGDALELRRVGSVAPRLEAVQVTGDVRFTGSLSVAEGVSYRSISGAGAVVFDPGAAITGLVRLNEQGSSSVLMGDTATGLAAVADTGSLVIGGAFTAVGARVENGNRTVGLVNRGVVEIGGFFPSVRDFLFVENRGVMRFGAGTTAAIETGASLRNAGVLEVDSSTDLTVTGDYEQSADALLRYRVSQRPGASRRTTVFGDSSLAGSFEVTITDDASVEIGDVWTVQRVFGALDGWFDAVSLPQPIESDTRLLLRTRPGSTGELLELVARHVADVNADGIVDATDLSIVTRDYGLVGEWLEGDANTDGVVNFSDLNLVLASSGVSYALVVPAPGGAIPALLLGACVGARRRRTAL